MLFFMTRSDETISIFRLVRVLGFPISGIYTYYKRLAVELHIYTRALWTQMRCPEVIARQAGKHLRKLGKTNFFISRKTHVLSGQPHMAQCVDLGSHEGVCCMLRRFHVHCAHDCKIKASILLVILVTPIRSSHTPSAE